MTWTHFKAEGDVEFRSILYVPKAPPHNFYDKYYEKNELGLKLYVRRVFISDDITDLLPRWVGAGRQEGRGCLSVVVCYEWQQTSQLCIKMHDGHVRFLHH